MPARPITDSAPDLMNRQHEPFSTWPWNQLASGNVLQRPAERQHVALQGQLMLAQYAYFDILVFTCDPIEKQIESPPAGNAPVALKICENPQDLLRFGEWSLQVPEPPGAKRHTQALRL